MTTIRFSSDMLIGKAVSLADEIAHAAKRSPSGALSWLAMRSVELPSEPVPIGPHLYGGGAGVAIFLAALAKTTGEQKHAETVQAILGPLQQRFAALLADPARAAALKLRFGAFFGLGSLTYSFLCAGRLLDRPDWCEHAIAMTRLATDQMLAEDVWYDLMFGAAGWILVLLALREQTADEGERQRLLELASRAGRHLVRSAKSHDGLPRAWYTTPEAPPMTGYSHGAAGIVYSLAKLYQATGEPELKTAIDEGLEFERSQFVTAKQNWRDMRFGAGVCGETWCHGAPGIGLGRLAMNEILADERIAAEARVGIEGALRHGRREIDHLCCGNAGRAEILLTAGELLGEPELRHEGLKVVLQVIDRAERQGGYRWLTKEEGEHFDPSFFNGAAGVGYTFLRFAAAAGTLPSVLLLE